MPPRSPLLARSTRGCESRQSQPLTCSPTSCHPRSYLFTQVSFIISPTLLELVIAFCPMYTLNRLMVRGQGAAAAQEALPDCAFRHALHTVCSCVSCAPPAPDCYLLSLPSAAAVVGAQGSRGLQPGAVAEPALLDVDGTQQHPRHLQGGRR